MQQFGETFAKPGSNPAFTYADCIKWVKSFNCGVKVVTPVDVEITLALKIYETIVDRGAGENGQNIYNTTDVAYTVFEKKFDFDGAIELDTVEGINDVVIDSYTTDETKTKVANAIANLDAESAAQVSANVIAAVGEDKGEYVAVPGTNDYLEITYVPSTSDNALLEDGVVFDVTAEIGNIPVNELDHPVLVKIPLAEVGLAAGERIEKIYHEHEGVVEELDFVVEGDYVLIKMYKFSPISIVKSTAPQTGEAILKLVAAPAEAGKAAFDVILVGDTSNTVRNLSAGEFTLNYPAGVSARYELIPNKTVDIHKEAVNGDSVTYTFHVGCDNVETIWTADDANIINNGIKIATLDITGRNVEGTISIDVVEMEKSFIDSNGTQTAAITAVDGADVDFEIGVPTKKLTVKIDLNAFRTLSQAAAYQAMTLKVEGEDIDTKIINLGSDNAETPFAGNIYTVELDLPENGIYKVELSAPGYRKADYEISMEYDKVLTFWNNSKTSEKAMEEYFATPTEKRADGKVKANFLAGDIVDDNIVNEYDLSAVVSYFGEKASDLTSAFRYITYDINRDGKVDSKDVAIVVANTGK